MRSALKTVVIGAGNVASHLVPALERCGAVDVAAVWSRTAEHAESLCRALNHAEPVTDLKALPDDAEFYLISVADDAVAEVAAQIGDRGEALCAHTSGSVPMDALAGMSRNYGVFYPLQTFSRSVSLDVEKVPFFIEGCNPFTVSALKGMAEMVSERVYEADSALRGKMHTAAVIACNFANHMWALADDYLKKETGLDISVLEPLLNETLRKAMNVGPAEAQTGPARRGDRDVMEHHENILPAGTAELYRAVSESIVNYYKNKR